MFLERNFQLVNNSQKPFYLMSMIQKWLALVLDLIITCMAVLVVGIAFVLRDTISPGFTGVALTQIISLTSNLTTMVLFWASLETSLSAVARIKGFSEDTEKETIPKCDVLKLSPTWPEFGRIEIRDVSAKYGYVPITNLLLAISASILLTILKVYL